MARLKVLAIAVATGRMGYVFFYGGELCHWGKVCKASESPALALRQTKKWIKRFKPDVVITEDIGKQSRKGRASRAIIAALARYASDLKVSDIVITRAQRFQNKYEEAKALAQQFPDLMPWVPAKPRIWESEPRSTIYFEALALALPIVRPDDD